MSKIATTTVLLLDFLFGKIRWKSAPSGTTRAKSREGELISKKFKTDKLKVKKIIPNRFPNKSKTIPRLRWFRSAKTKRFLH